MDNLFTYRFVNFSVSPQLLFPSDGGVWFPILISPCVVFQNIAAHQNFGHSTRPSHLWFFSFSESTVNKAQRGISYVVGRSLCPMSILFLLKLICDVAYSEATTNIFVADFIKPRYVAHIEISSFQPLRYKDKLKLCRRYANAPGFALRWSS